MAVLNESAVGDARTMFETLVGALQGKRSQGAWTRIAKLVKGVGSIAHETIMPGATPTWVEWTDEADFGGFRKLSRRTPLKKYHKTLALDRTSVVYDQDGSTAAAMEAFLGDFEALYDKLVFDMLMTNPTGIDGVALLHDSHPYGSSTTWDNKNGSALTFGTFQTEVERMMALLDEQGEPIGLNPNVLVVGPSSRQIAKEIVGAEDRPIAVSTAGAYTPTAGIVGATSITNIYKADNWELIVSPRVTSTNWCVIDSRYPPLKLVEWRSPEAVILDDMAGETRARRDEFLYKVEADMAADGVQPYGIAGTIA